MKKCKCPACNPRAKEEYDFWRFRVHRDFVNTELKSPTERISVGQRVSLASGETGTVVGKNWSYYQVEIDQLEDEDKVRSFEERHVKPLKIPENS